MRRSFWIGRFIFPPRGSVTLLFALIEGELLLAGAGVESIGGGAIFVTALNGGQAISRAHLTFAY
jgi:hypothetical protein